MTLVDVGSGPPIVIVPGIQGRWEWMKPAVDALARDCRVITFSLADEPACGGRFDAARGFSSYVRQIGDAMDQANVGEAVVCGVSYGGLIASAFAARYPHRVCGLILVSALPPSWKPDRRVRFYLRAPRLLLPVFLVASLRMYREIAAATPGVLRGALAGGRHALNVLTHMFSASRMARRVHMLEAVDLSREIGTVSAPALVITGEPHLDRVVPVRLTEEYMGLCRRAERAVIPHTGHLGSITRPGEFAALVAPFVRKVCEQPRRRRHVG